VPKINELNKTPPLNLPSKSETARASVGHLS